MVSRALDRLLSNSPRFIRFAIVSALPIGSLLPCISPYGMQPLHPGSPHVENRFCSLGNSARRGQLLCSRVSRGWSRIGGLFGCRGLSSTQEAAMNEEPVGGPLEREDFSCARHPALAYWWSMIFSENRYPLFGIML